MCQNETFGKRSECTGLWVLWSRAEADFCKNALADVDMIC